MIFLNLLDIASCLLFLEVEPIAGRLSLAIGVAIIMPSLAETVELKSEDDNSEKCYP